MVRTQFLFLVACPFFWGHVIGAPSWPNEPVGATQLFDCGFDNTTCGGTLKDIYNSTGYSLNVAQDATAPLSPPNVMRSTRFANNPTGGCELEYALSGRPVEIYAGLWWRTSPVFMGKSNGQNKLFFIRGQNTLNGLFRFDLAQGAASGSIIWTTQSSNNLDQCGGTDIDVCRSNVNNVPIAVGKWYKIEAYLKASSCPTCHDGTVRWWITPRDGTPVLAGNYEKFAYGMESGDGWRWSWAETWDGSGGANDWPTEASHYVDHLHISAPNCGPGGCAAPAYLVITSSLTLPRTGVPYVATLTAAGGTKPYTWFRESGNLPAGLTLNQSTGVIAGTPTCVGRSDFTIRVTDGGQPALTATKSYTIITSGTSTSCPPTSSVAVPDIEAEQAQLFAKAVGGKMIFKLPVTSGAPSRLSIYDLAGKMVYEHSSMGQREISIAKVLKKGIYLAKFAQGPQWSAVRFSVMN